MAAELTPRGNVYVTQCKMYPHFARWSSQTPDKIRIILLYIYHKGGITEENLKNSFHTPKSPEKDECIIRNMAKMNIQIFTEANKNKKTPQLSKKDRSAEVKYALSRYTPAIKDVMEVKFFRDWSFLFFFLNFKVFWQFLKK